MEEIQLTSQYGKCPLIYRVFLSQVCVGFLPSTVSSTTGGSRWSWAKDGEGHHKNLAEKLIDRGHP